MKKSHSSTASSLYEKYHLLPSDIFRVLFAMLLDIFQYLNYGFLV